MTFPLSDYSERDRRYGPPVERSDPPLARWSIRRALAFMLAASLLLWVAIVKGGAWLWEVGL